MVYTESEKKKMDQIREVFGLQGTPVRITIRQKGDKEE